MQTIPFKIEIGRETQVCYCNSTICKYSRFPVALDYQLKEVAIEGGKCKSFEARP
jgi:hypothetical protein